MTALPEQLVTAFMRSVVLYEGGDNYARADAEDVHTLYTSATAVRYAVERLVAELPSGTKCAPVTPALVRELVWRAVQREPVTLTTGADLFPLRLLSQAPPSPQPPPPVREQVATQSPSAPQPLVAVDCATAAAVRNKFTVSAEPDAGTAASVVYTALSPLFGAEPPTKRARTVRAERIEELVAHVFRVAPVRVARGHRYPGLVFAVAAPLQSNRQ